jgi:hypothetical protein
MGYLVTTQVTPLRGGNTCFVCMKHVQWVLAMFQTWRFIYICEVKIMKLLV